MESHKGRRGKPSLNWAFDIVSLRSYHQFELMFVLHYQNLVGVAQ